MPRRGRPPCRVPGNGAWHVERTSGYGLGIKHACQPWQAQAGRGVAGGRPEPALRGGSPANRGMRGPKPAPASEEWATPKLRGTRQAFPQA
eukprot:2238392-Alexandrium_andersonii.AAC.1